MPNCSKCGNQVTDDSLRKVNGLCEDCYLETKLTKKRKTHWQYVKSIKTEYLMPVKKEKN